MLLPVTIESVWKPPAIRGKENGAHPWRADLSSMGVTGELQGDPVIIPVSEGIRLMPTQDDRSIPGNTPQRAHEIGMATPRAFQPREDEVTAIHPFIGQDPDPGIADRTIQGRTHIPLVVISPHGEDSQPRLEPAEKVGKRSRPVGPVRDEVARQHDKVHLLPVDSGNCAGEKTGIAKIIEVQIGHEGDAKSVESGMPGGEKDIDPVPIDPPAFHEGGVSRSGCPRQGRSSHYSNPVSPRENHDTTFIDCCERRMNGSRKFDESPGDGAQRALRGSTPVRYLERVG